MTREDAVERLCDVYGGSFDITRCKEAELPLAAKMDFYVHNSKYVLSKKAKLWEANSFEYVYLFTVPHLTREIYEQCERPTSRAGPASGPAPTICTPISPPSSCATPATRRHGRP